MTDEEKARAWDAAHPPLTDADRAFLEEARARQRSERAAGDIVGCGLFVILAGGVAWIAIDQARHWLTAWLLP